MTTTTVTKSEKTVKGSADSPSYDVEQYSTTIPKALAEAMEMDGGEQLVWKVESGDRLSFKVTDG